MFCGALVFDFIYYRRKNQSPTEDSLSSKPAFVIITLERPVKESDLTLVSEDRGLPQGAWQNSLRLVNPFPYALLFLLASLSAVWAEVSFNRDIRPILADTCYHCHGPDSKKQYPKKKPLTLDSFEAVTADRGGYNAIVPGHPEQSELIARIFSDREDEVMPPPDSHRSITDVQKELLRQWIAEGANYEKHWAFVPPVKAELPPTSDNTWAHNPIDQFVLAKLDSEKLRPSPSADRETLIRRATRTLIGFPPTPQEVDHFLADSSPEAYSKLLDRLLASPSYGERMALFWLEAARYADTDGYQNDGERTMWPWRDWVIKAFNDNMPFDDFTVKQLAGDMLPGNDLQNVLASAFNRNHRINNEGGALPEEFIVEYAIDRVETTGTVWMGLTAGCARCHDHKYDPISQKEFYQLYGYFNSISERGKAAGKNAPPQIKISSPLLDPDLSRSLAAAQAALDKAKDALQAKNGQVAWENEALARFENTAVPTWVRGTILRSSTTKGGELKELEDGSLLKIGKNGSHDSYAIEIDPGAGLGAIAAMQLEAIPDPSFAKPIGFSHSANGNFVLTNVKLSIRDKSGKLRLVPLTKATHNFSQEGFSAAALIDGKPSSGWAASGFDPKLGTMIATLEPEKPLALPAGSRLVVQLEHGSQYADHNLGRFRLSFSATSAPATKDSKFISALRTDPAKRKADQKILLLNRYEQTDSAIKKLSEALSQLQKRPASQEVNVLVMKESATPTPTYLLGRGQYTEPDKSEMLTRGVPVALNPNKPQPKDRLELARWLASPDNPLGARVTVNRIWQQHFGRGIVNTPNNFGLQGAAPSHPDLLDWLAVDFMEHGWDLKRLQKLMLSSATWQQSSKATPALFERDPDNHLLSHGPRFRLDGSAIRDNALFASGLLNPALGGPPVKPYQPTGLWNVVAAGAGTRYTPSKGRDLYRRSIYTYWKRAVNPPRMLIFDSATREYCVVDRNSTNTPLQALVLMNDVTFVEAARALAERMMNEGGETVEARLEFGFRLAIGIKPTETELNILRKTYDDFRMDFTKDPKSAEEFLTPGESPRDQSLDPVEHAAFTAAAHLTLNLDRSINLE